MSDFFRASLEIFIFDGPLHDRYTRPLHRRRTVTPAILGPFLRATKWRTLSLERLNDRAPQILPPPHDCELPCRVSVQREKQAEALTSDKGGLGPVEL